MRILLGLLIVVIVAVVVGRLVVAVIAIVGRLVAVVVVRGLIVALRTLGKILTFVDDIAVLSSHALIAVNSV